MPRFKQYVIYNKPRIDFKRKTFFDGQFEAVCQQCLEDLGTVFYDCKTMRGYWAILCQRCFEVFGIGEGPGICKKYDTEQ